MSRLLKFLLILAALSAAYFFIFYAPAQASFMYGAPAPHLTLGQRVLYAAKLSAYGDSLFAPLNPNGAPQAFRIVPGEPAASVAERLQQAGVIANAPAFLDYLIYSGLDLSLQAGEYSLSPALSSIEIARALQDSTPGKANFVVLPGWRMEEIAASLPTSGLSIAPADFLSAAKNPPAALNLPPEASRMEGFFFPAEYVLPRETALYQLLDVAARNFAQHISAEMQSGYQQQGVTLYQAVTLASLIEREAVRTDEMPLIASVFYNRLAIGMTLGSDPTVQYALGYDALNQTWWKNPLSLTDLKFDSPYNTYLYAGLPPAPIANPSLQALQAAAFPAESPYYYFQARCDASGYHNFAVSFEEHLANSCQP
ncbi:MAG: endolytic transglycosylase MltG [Anaerolineales bacterium]